MKAPSIAPAYVPLYVGLTEVARKHGYALAAHGSVVTDFDLVAVPWTDSAIPAQELIDAIAKHLTICLETVGFSGNDFSKPELRPHGRQAWLIPLKWGALDISVMPLKARSES